MDIITLKDVDFISLNFMLPELGECVVKRH